MSTNDRVLQNNHLRHREGLTTVSHDWTMVKAGSLVEKQTLVTIDADATVEDACEVLLKNGITSAPVYDSVKKMFVGMFDYGDLMTYLLLLLKKMDVPLEDQTMEMRDLIQRTSRSQNVPVKLASDLSGKDPFCTVLEETRLGSVVHDFGTGIHRVAVMDTKGNMKGILSQSSTLDYLMRHLSEYPQLQPVMQKSLQQCGLSNGRVLSVNGDEKVLDALISMSTNSVSSLAVLDEQGVLLGNISMTDIKHIMKNLRTSWLWITCFQLVCKIRLSQGVESGEDQYPVLDVNAKSTFGYTLSKLQATKAHRMWVVNDSGCAVGVVSLTDVFRVLSRLIDNDD
ncbi:cell separation during budding [Linnemannia elongata]|nr:cell separation during budding [Linnemannia elongata]KAG0062552.1 cell separation during budding [Linnemannia elongata]